MKRITHIYKCAKCSTRNSVSLFYKLDATNVVSVALSRHEEFETLYDNMHLIEVCRKCKNEQFLSNALIVKTINAYELVVKHQIN